ncbi:MAG: T9SS type B sorting domain-containing protein [Winogradskyella sp.]|nr:T9SS type B sorting domain-containing protein [Winogradskyella sp.]
MSFKLILSAFIVFNVITLPAQDVSLYEQFNGRYDYVAIGNTLNSEENGPDTNCSILSTSSATLNLQPQQNIIAAYLYWAGSGVGDFDIEINDIPITAERTFSDTLDNERVFFAAFADVTEIIQDQGNTTYTISELDLTTVINPYCPTGTNFGGWAIAIVFQDENLPLNQLNVYDGLQSVPTNLNITLDNLNVLDNEGAKIGFIAWEGDNDLAVNEQLTINGNTISNPPLNPANNAFNGTNSFTGQSNLYNMDIDVYNIQNNINIGDTSATISLTSGQDFVMINNIITVLNSQLPDATINIDDFYLECDSRIVELNYTVNNFNSTDPLPVNTPIAFYANTTLVGQSFTVNTIPVNESESGTIELFIPESEGDTFYLLVVVDDDGMANGQVNETNEVNNDTSVFIELLIIPEIIQLPNVIACNEGFETAQFDLTVNTQNFDQSSITFYNSLADLQNNTNEIPIPEAYINSSNPEVIYAKVETAPCYEIYEFQLLIENCPPHIPEGFSPNGDSINDWFNIQGLYNIFTAHQLQIYNRYGTLIFVGNNDSPWNGIPNRGITNMGKPVPVGVYYYILKLNDPNYKPITGWVYVNY